MFIVAFCAEQKFQAGIFPFLRKGRGSLLFHPVLGLKKKALIFFLEYKLVRSPI